MLISRPRISPNRHCGSPATTSSKGGLCTGRASLPTAGATPPVPPPWGDATNWWIHQYQGDAVRLPGFPTGNVDMNRFNTMTRGATGDRVRWVQRRSGNVTGRGVRRCHRRGVAGLSEQEGRRCGRGGRPAHVCLSLLVESRAQIGFRLVGPHRRQQPLWPCSWAAVLPSSCLGRAGTMRGDSGEIRGESRGISGESLMTCDVSRRYRRSRVADRNERQDEEARGGVAPPGAASPAGCPGVFR